MSTAAVHEAPSWKAVATEQVRMVGLMLRGGGLLLLGLLVALVTLASLQMLNARATQAAHPFTVNYTFTPEISATVTFMALIIPLMVWRDEDPLQRGYHWLMPVSRPAHAAARIYAGWVWTMAATFAFVASILLVTVLTEAISGQSQPYHANFHAWEWLVPFTSASISYLFASSAAVAARRPLLWIFGIIATYAGIVLLLLQRGMLDQARSVMVVWGGYLGGRAATFGVMPTADGRDLHDPMRWLAATAVWGGVAVVLLWLCASRHRESA